MIANDAIIEEVLMLRKKGLSILKISHAVSRSHPRFCQKSRKQKNFCGSDILKIIQELKAQGRLPTTLLDDIKEKIGEKGRFKSKLTKPRKKDVTPPLTFNL